MTIDFPRQELYEIRALFIAAEGRFPEAFWTAEAKISAALHPPRIADLFPDVLPATRTRAESPL